LATKAQYDAPHDHLIEAFARHFADQQSIAVVDAEQMAIEATNRSCPRRLLRTVKADTKAVLEAELRFAPAPKAAKPRFAPAPKAKPKAAARNLSTGRLPKPSELKEPKREPKR